MDRIMELVVIVLVFAAAFASTTVDAASTNESSRASGQRHELHVLLMTSSSQRFNSSGAESAVRQALYRVNTDTSILPGYQVQLTVSDSKVSVEIMQYM